MTRSPTSVIVDLDGTLVDTVATRVEGWMAAFMEEGIPSTPDTIAPLIGSDGRELARRVGSMAGLSLSEEDLERIDARAGALFSDLNRDPRPLPGAAAFLAKLDELGVPWAIATSSRAEQAVRSLDPLRLARPPAIVDGSGVRLAKPDPALLLAAAKRLGTAPASAWSVGDSTWDVLAGKAAGMTAIAVTAGSASTASELDEAGADLVVRSLEDLVLRLSPGA